MNCPNCDAEIGFFSYFKNTNKITCKKCDSKYEIKRTGFQFWFNFLIAGLSGGISSAISRYFFPDTFTFKYYLTFITLIFIFLVSCQWFLWKFWKFEFEKRWT